MSVYDDYAAILGDDLFNSPRASSYIECTDECKQRQADWKVAIAAYEATWPNYCRKCNGRGGHVYYDDPGDRHCSLPGGFMELDEPCEHCLEDGICPRCGKLAWPDNYEYDLGEMVCPHCDWREDHAEEDGAPEQPECWCWEERLP